MGKFQGIRDLFSFKTVIVVILAVGATYLCREYDITAEFPLTLITTAVIFPIVFSIGGAYKRREVALDQYGSIKAHGRAVYYAARDWLADTDAETQETVKARLGDLLSNCRTMFAEPLEKLPENEVKVYRSFSELSKFVKQMRQMGLASGECSRCNQYISKMVVAFENVKHIYQYRTPVTLRAYSDVFLVVLPVVYGPHFAYISKDYAPGLEYIMPILFTVILSSLDNIQDHLENPFDQIGADDVMINPEKFVKNLEWE